MGEVLVCWMGRKEKEDTQEKDETTTSRHHSNALLLECGYYDWVQGRWCGVHSISWLMMGNTRWLIRLEDTCISQSMGKL
nr:hypothetical protein Iba_chr06dCG4210 [Ipomoea batatas]